MEYHVSIKCWSGVLLESIDWHSTMDALTCSTHDPNCHERAHPKEIPCLRDSDHEIYHLMSHSLTLQLQPKVSETAWKNRSRLMRFWFNWAWFVYVTFHPRCCHYQSCWDTPEVLITEDHLVCHDLWLHLVWRLHCSDCCLIHLR